MSYNRFDALSSSDSDSVESFTDSPTSVFDLQSKNKRHGKTKKQETVTLEAVNDGDFEPSVLRCLRRVYGGEMIDKQLLKKYFKEVEESEGFDINSCPGYIRGVTTVLPYPDLEKYDETMKQATTAMKIYNKTHYPSNYKVAEVKKVNTAGHGMCRYYYITFSGVHVKGKNGSLGSKIYQQFASVMVIFILWLCALFPPYEYNTCSLRKLLLELDSAPELKASEDEISKTTECRTFQAKVMDNSVKVKREVILCRTVRE